MLIRRIFIYFFLVIILLGCSDNNSCNQITLTNKEKQWYKFYTLGDSVIFGNSTHEQAFIITSKGQDFTPCMKFELGPNIYEYQAVLLKNKSFEIVINFSKEHQDKNETNCKKFIHVSDLHTRGVSDLEVLKKQDVFVPYLNDTIKTYLITSDTLTVDIDGGIQAVKSFNWSEKYGVVRYTRYTDEVFDLLEKK